MLRIRLISVTELVAVTISLSLSSEPSQHRLEGRHDDLQRVTDTRNDAGAAGTPSLECASVSAGGQAVANGNWAVVGQLGVGLISIPSVEVIQGVVPCWLRNVGGFALTRYSFGTGNVDGAAGVFTLRATAGEPVVGVVSAGSFTLTAGYWPPLSILGDCNGSGAVDVTDYPPFASCLDGPGQGAQTGCACFDLRPDRHVDLLDFWLFQNAITRQE
jgi:hypothetical protein